MTTASFIFSPCISADKLESCADKLLSRGWKDVELLVFQSGKNPETAHCRALNQCKIVSLGKTPVKLSLPAMLNRASDCSTGDVIVFVADCVEFSPEFMKVCIALFAERSRNAWLYSPFTEVFGNATRKFRDVRTDACDFSENSQIGPVRAVRRSCFEAVGGYDQSLQFAFEYDLRLRLMEHGDAVRSDHPLYTVYPVVEETGWEREHAHFLGYVRSESVTRARSYLDYEQDEEWEFSNTCMRALQQCDAFLQEPAGRLHCRHSDQETPLVTVVIPLWNREDYIGAALQSVLRSEEGPFEFEIVVVDNGSTDGSLSVVHGLMEEGPVRLLRNEVNNIAGALNAAIGASNAKYICQLDSDDLYTPETLKTLVGHMEANPQAALGVSYYDCIGPDGEPLGDRGVVRHLEYDPNNLMRTDGIGHARIWHRCVLEDLGGFDEQNLGNYAEDYDLQLKLCEHHEILRIPHVLYHYRMGHKKPGETIDYANRHRKKTWARRAAIARRQRINR